MYVQSGRSLNGFFIRLGNFYAICPKHTLELGKEFCISYYIGMKKFATSQCISYLFQYLLGSNFMAFFFQNAPNTLYEMVLLLIVDFNLIAERLTQLRPLDARWFLMFFIRYVWWSSRARHNGWCSC